MIHEEIWTIMPWTSAIGIFLFLALLLCFSSASLVNRTTIKVDPERLEIMNGPFPRRWGRSYPISAIKEIRAKDYWLNSRYSTLIVVLLDGRRITLVPQLTPRNAEFMARRFTEFSKERSGQRAPHRRRNTK